MGRLQSGRTCSDDETGKIVAFLKTLTGDPPQFLLPSSDKTKRPQPFD